MNISICITVFNEEQTIAKLLDSLLNQTKKAGEIIIVDGGSRDKTVEIVRHYQKKDNSIKLLVEKVSRAGGRNIAIEMAKNEIITMTDAGCLPMPDWLQKISDPFKNEEIDVVAGFYRMVAENSFQKGESIYLGTTPERFNMGFLPSTRSIAFRKSVWEKVGGFPENLQDTAEDTVFNYRLLKDNIKISRMKNAVVEWGMPETLSEFFLKIKNYAKGDAKTKIFIFPGKGLASHNIKALFILGRYIVGIAFLTLSIVYNIPLILSLILFLVYLFWAYRKAGIWGPVLQITSDIGVMIGFIEGFVR